MESPIARYYVADANPEGGQLPGVPLRDLLESEYAALPDWLKASIDASPMYRKTAPKPAAPAAKE